MNIMKFPSEVQRNIFNVTAAVLHASNLTWIEKHGDEALRQIALFCLGKWHSIHSGVIQEMIEMEDTAASIAAAMDSARVSGAIQMLESVGSFGGDDSWRDMLKESIISEVDEHKAREQNDG